MLDPIRRRRRRETPVCVTRKWHVGVFHNVAMRAGKAEQKAINYRRKEIKHRALRQETTSNVSLLSVRSPSRQKKIAERFNFGPLLCN